jgi:hypothetical protein
MARHPISMLAGLTLGLVLLPAVALAQGAAATLTVLVQPVERIARGDADPAPGASGMNLAEGDRIRTGDRGIALITFLDGSTVTLQPGSEVTVQQASRRAASGIRLLIHAGRAWARVARVAGAAGGLALESNEYAATAHDGLIGAERLHDGGLVCWTRRGELRLTDRMGHSVAVLGEGQRARASQSQPVTPEPFRPSASTLEVRTAGPVVPLVRLPEGDVAAGFLAPDAEVAQVFGALSAPLGREAWLVEVPAGHDGPYTVVLTGTGAGAFRVQVTARYAGLTVYRQELTGTAAPGERLYTRLTQRVEGADPRSARVSEARFDPLKPWEGPEPAAVLGPGLGRAGVN